MPKNKTKQIPDKLCLYFLIKIKQFCNFNLYYETFYYLISSSSYYYNYYI